MNNQDLLYRFLFENKSIRGEWVRLHNSYRTIVLQHQYPVLIRQLLGELLVVVSLLRAVVKLNGRITVQFQGKSKLKLLMTQCDQDFKIRGLAQYLSKIRPDELSELFKEGLMVITIEPLSGQRYQGIVAWQGDSVARSIECYFKESEQLPTRLWISVDKNTATGLLLQMMPDSGFKTQQEDDWEHIIHLTQTLTQKELIKWDLATLLRRLYVEEDVRLFNPESVTFQCSCSIQRSENAIRILGKKEAEEEIKDKKILIVTCEFCSKKYTFDQIEVAEIFSGKDNSASSQLH